MKTLIVMQLCTAGAQREIRVECDKFHAQAHDGRSLLTIFAQGSDGSLIAAFESVEEAFFKDSVTFQSTAQLPGK